LKRAQYDGVKHFARHPAAASAPGLWAFARCLALSGTIFFLHGIADAQPGSSSKLTGSFRIAGKVVNSVTGDAVPGVFLTAHRTDDDQTQATAVSGEDGSFAMEHLPAGVFNLSASKRGFHAGDYDEHDGYNTAIVTGEGLDTEGLSFRLTPGAVIRGRVTDDFGDPAQQASVILFREYDRDANQPIVQQGGEQTDDTGDYEFGNLQAGTYFVAVRTQPWYAMHLTHKDRPETDAEASLDAAYPPTYFDSTTEEASATPIAVAAGTEQEANIVLHAVPAVHLSFSAPMKADGTREMSQLEQVIFGQLTPAEGSDAVFIGRDNARSGLAIADPAADSQTGMEEIDSLAPGRYILTQDDPPRMGELNASASGKVDPNFGNAASVINGKVVAEPGVTLPGVFRLGLSPGGEGTGKRSVSTVVEGGVFQFPAVGGGAWRIGVSNDLAALATSVDGKQQPGDRITVEDDHVQLVVTVGNQERNEVTGFVRQGGKAASGVMVVLVPKDLTQIAELVRRDQSNSDGSFSLYQVSPGQYTVVAIQDGWDLEWFRPEVLAGFLPMGTPVTIKVDSGKLVRLPEPLTPQSSQGFVPR
jgi:hypothetical protein